LVFLTFSLTDGSQDYRPAPVVLEVLWRCQLWQSAAALKRVQSNVTDLTDTVYFSTNWPMGKRAIILVIGRRVRERSHLSHRRR